jgi:predicted enzyme related to lactoylglutathione lyase
MRCRTVSLLLASLAAVVGCRVERNPVPDAGTVAAGDVARLEGVQTVIYHVSDLAAAKDFYTRLLGHAPYFDEPFYVGYQVGRFELGLDPDTTGAPPGTGGVVAYWTVTDVEAAIERALGMGATAHGAVQEVGGGIRTGSVRDPFGNVVGFIDNPAFGRTER